MATNLYELIEQSNKNSKAVRLGYTVSSYNEVLKELGIYQQINGEVVEHDSTTDYVTVNEINYDGNSFSYDPGKELWKMKLQLFGSLIIKDDTGKYQIICVEGNKAEDFENTNPNQLPQLLENKNFAELTKLGGKFEVGVFVDVNSKLQQYMNSMYSSPSTDSFNEKQIWALINNRLLIAQIIPMNSSVNVQAKILGTTSGSNKDVMLVNPMFAISEQGRQLKIPLIVNNYDGQTVDVDGGGVLSCPLKNKKYNIKNATLEGLVYDGGSSDGYKQWYEQRNENPHPISLKQIEPIECSVKIYISDKEKAKEILKFEPLERAFSPIVEAISIPMADKGAEEFNYEKAKDCIIAAMQEKNYRIWTKNHIGGSSRTSNFTLVGDGRNDVRATSQNKAMAGSFYIPAGWPMCQIQQQYSGRSVSDQIRKGYEKQKTTNQLLSWVIAQNDRLDPELNASANAIKSKIKSRGQSWIDERIRRAGLGPIEVKISSALQPGNPHQRTIAQLWGDFFNLVLSVYARAAELYNNTSITAEHQTSATELLLRCAPSLCAIKGNSPVHRIDNRNNGHYVGRAIDFDHEGNDDTADRSKNEGTEIVKGMSDYYSPAIYAIFALGGYWGGAHKFASGNTRYDAMHFQF